MSQSYRIKQNITDPLVIGGEIESSVEVNLPELVSQGNYEVAGRIFFEATLNGNFTTSYLANGFIDRMDYK